MILDERSEFCDAVTGISAASTTTLRGDVYDLVGVGTMDPAGGRPVYLVITIDTAFVSANNNPTTFKLVTDAAAAILTDGTASEHVITDDFLPADLTLGKKIVYVLPPAIARAYERFMGILQVVGAGASGVTAGAFSAALTLDPSDWKAYPDASN